MNIKLYVGNLEWSVTEDDLKTYFSQCGEVEKAMIILNRNTGRSKGFGFVTMADEPAAEKALKTLDGTELNGRVLSIREAKPEGEKTGLVGKNDINKVESDLTKAIKDFCLNTADLDDTLGFTVGIKHFTLKRDL